MAEYLTGQLFEGAGLDVDGGQVLGEEAKLALDGCLGQGRQLHPKETFRREASGSCIRSIRCGASSSI